MDNLKFIFCSGKNPKWRYFAAAYAWWYGPHGLCRARLPKLLAEAAARPDYEYMCRRRDYYCRLTTPVEASAEGNGKVENLPSVGDLKLGKQKTYPLDMMRYARYFDPQLPLLMIPGDVTEVPSVPAIVKSRPIAPPEVNANSVLMKLNAVRHYIFPTDRKPFADKIDTVLFRGKVGGKGLRMRLMEQFYGREGFDLGDVSRHPAHEEWSRSKLTIREQLNHKFILSIEGNDVATNLKWIMASNSVAVTPDPVYETWFMEGTLEPNVHYISIKPDYSDLEERIAYYLEHPAEAEAIAANAQEYVEQFRDERREFLIGLMVLEKYFYGEPR